MATQVESTEKTLALRGPRPRGLLGNLGEFRRDRLGFLERSAREYGDVVPLRLGPRRFLLVSHPDLIEEVLVTNQRKYIKHFALRQAKRSLGNGLLTSEGEFWRRQRRLAQPAFQRERVAAYAPVMVERTERMLAGWALGQNRNVQDDMMRVTLEIVAQTLFGADVGAASAGISAAMEVMLRAFTHRVERIFKLPEFVPTPGNIRMKRAARRLDDIVFGMIARRRAQATENAGAGQGNDLLSILLRAADEVDGERMTDRQLRDEAMTLFLAGHETTANTLAWAWYLLAQHPECEHALHEELDRVLGGRAPTFDDLAQLPYADRVITETLRIYPTVWLLGREAIEETQVGPHRVPVGMTVFMSQWVVHRDPRFFDEPETFRPERWADGLLKRIPRYAYFPFGGGPRICIGNAFAQMEAVLLLATIAQRFRLRLAPGARVRPWPSMTLRPDGGLPMTLLAR